MSAPYALIPYAVADGVPSFRDSEIRGWYERLEAEGLARWVFFDAKQLSGDDLLRLVKKPGNFTFTVWTEGEHWRPEMAAFFWMHHFIGTTVFLHHVVFRKFHGTQAVAIGKFVLAEVTRMGFCESVMGITPANNRLAVRFAKSIGMQRLGVVPRIFYDAYENRQVDGFLTVFEGAGFRVQGSGGKDIAAGKPLPQEQGKEAA
jgi:hypothetical protein